MNKEYVSFLTTEGYQIVLPIGSFFITESGEGANVYLLNDPKSFWKINRNGFLKLKIAVGL